MKGEKLCVLRECVIAKHDEESLIEFFHDLDDYGLAYYFETNLNPNSFVSGKNVLCGNKEERKTYTVKIWGLDHRKALKSPAYWMSLLDVNTGLPKARLFEYGSPGKYLDGVAISRVVDQISLMWSKNPIERSGLRLEDMLSELGGVYTSHKFILEGFVGKNGYVACSEPIMIIRNKYFDRG